MEFLTIQGEESIVMPWDIWAESLGQCWWRGYASCIRMHALQHLLHGFSECTMPGMRLVGMFKDNGWEFKRSYVIQEMANSGIAKAH